MFTGIRFRLLVSYAVVIVVALTIAFVALVLLSRPIQLRLVEFALSTDLNRLITPLAQRELQDVRTGKIPARRIIAFLAEHIPANSRLFIATIDGRIIFDSEDQWAAQQLEFSSERRGRVPNISNGRFVGPNGKTYLYAATPLRNPEVDAPLIVAVLARPLPETASSLIDDLWTAFVVAGLIAFLISILLGIAIVRSVSNPLRRIALATQSVARGDYSQTVPETGPSEVKQVAQSFNSMTHQVQAGRMAMQDFVSNVSHELKTPLTSIQGFSQALLEDATPDQTSRDRAAQIIYDEATRMRRLVEELLDMARIDSGQMDISAHPISFTALLKGVLNNLSPQISDKQLTLIENFEHLPLINGDGDRLTQVFTNLMDNAIKYTPPNQEIRIEGTTELNPSIHTAKADSTASGKGAMYARLTITDSGSGVPRDELDRIFERFYQVDKSRKQGHGTGLGLAIAYNIIKAHGGHIQAQSTPGRGTQFVVWLPSA